MNEKLSHIRPCLRVRSRHHQGLCICSAKARPQRCNCSAADHIARSHRSRGFCWTRISHRQHDYLERDQLHELRREGMDLRALEHAAFRKPKRGSVIVEQCLAELQRVLGDRPRLDYMRAFADQNSADSCPGITRCWAPTDSAVPTPQETAQILSRSTVITSPSQH